MSEFVLSGQELFGRYARIAYGHALGGEQDYHIYKCIQSFRSNCYCDVPLTYQTENNCYNHENIVDVVNVIHCGIDENRVIRVALNDIELIPAPDVEPVKHGRIIESIENGKMKRVFSCCGEDFTKLTMWLRPNYCPNCGAHMDAPETPKE